MLTLPIAAVPPSDSAPFVFTSTNLCPSYFPSQGLGYSLFIHAIAFTTILVFPVFHSSTERFPLPQRATNNRSEDRVVMYLPIGGGGQGMGGELESSGNEPTAAPSSATEGLIYPGPQLVRSDSPQPTSHIQTLLQRELADLPIVNPPFLLNLLPMPEFSLVQQSEPPDLAVGPPDTVKPEEQQPVELEDLPILNPPLDLLNLLPMPKFALVQQFELPAPAVGLPDTVKPKEQQPVDPSDGVVTEPIRRKLEDLPIVNPPFLLNLLPMPEWAVEPIQPVVEPQLPTPVVPARLPSRKRDLRSVLALTPMPTWLEQPVEIPAGEALGRFTISPEPNLDTSETEPGVLETQTVGPAGDAVPGSGPGSSASGPGVGSGWGADSSPSKGALAGITIVGGVGRTEASVNSLPDSRIPRPRQTRYGLFVVSTENSGGGLPYFGVFSNAQINTVYLDMRQTETDTAPFWTLEFVVPRGIAIQANPAKELDESHEGFVLPVPVVKEQPALPLELVRRHIGKMVIVYTVINVEGKMEQPSVKESPDPLLNQPVLDALSKWVFRPGVLNGDPVAVKALLGIPLWLPLSPG